MPKTANSPSQPASNESGNRPAHEIRLGRLKAAIWANSTENGVRYNTTFRRIYKAGTEWHDSDSMGRDDLLLLAKLADQVHTWIFAQATAGAANGERGRNDEEEVPY